MRPLGRTAWAVPGGHIPLRSVGHEPESTSHDKFCLLNIAPEDANVEITIFYMDRDPVGLYRLVVPARRLRHVRVDDLIDPEAIPLDTAYASVITSTVPIMVQFSRLDMGQAASAILSTMAFPADS